MVGPNWVRENCLRKSLAALPACRPGTIGDDGRSKARTREEQEKTVKLSGGQILPKLLHAAAELVALGTSIREAAKLKGVSKSALARFVARHRTGESSPAFGILDTVPAGPLRYRPAASSLLGGGQMQIRKLEVFGFRGIRRAEIIFADRCVFVGPNGCGKSTIIDALALVVGRSKLVRQLTEHDFTGSSPEHSSRVRIIVTLGGLGETDPANLPDWFRDGRATPQWFDPATGAVEPEPDEGRELCVRLAFAARFDLDTLEVETKRYFDDGTNEDPFAADVPFVPPHLLHQLGFHVIPARRAWEGIASFGSELFRKAIRASGGVPANEVLAERDRLRQPESPLDGIGGLRLLAGEVDEILASVLPSAPKMKMRLTSTDAESVLAALVPHFEIDGTTQPAARHGSGLLALQTFALLVRLGSARRSAGESFILAFEEPELHVPPGLQRRLVSLASAPTTARRSRRACGPGWGLIYTPE